MEPFKLGPLQRKWVAYLKKHPEQQITGRLGKVVSGEKKMCCLGAGGIIVKSCRWSGENLVDEVCGYEETVLLIKGYNKLGLNNASGSIKNDSIEDAWFSLAYLNDDGEHTWIDIAYLIEAAPELFFNKSV
jgi:hypothetical protein